MEFTHIHMDFPRNKMQEFIDMIRCIFNHPTITSDNVCSIEYSPSIEQFIIIDNKNKKYTIKYQEYRDPVLTMID